ncbi:MAG TPA: hypothetical protein VF120_02300, partial [Ktedonobacterales bacterium]
RMMPALAPTPPTADELLRLAGLCLQIDSKGRLLAIIGCGVRGLIGSLLPVRTGLIAYGDSGAGKTTSVNVGRCVSGMYPLQAVGDVNLGSFSPSGPEARIKGIRDCLLMVDDARRRGEAGTTGADDAKLVDLLDSWFTAAADDEEIRSRASRDMTHKEGTYVKAFLAATAEYLPALSESRLRRIMVFGYQVGEIAHAYLHEVHDELKTLIARGGTAVIRRMLARLGEHGESAATGHIADWEQRQANRLYQDLRQVRATARDEFVRSIANNYARPLAGVWLLERACLTLAAADDGFLVSTLYPFLVELAATQLDIVETHAAHSINAAWITDATRRARHDGLAHLLDMKEQPLVEANAGVLTDYGYARGGPDGWTARGVYLGNLSNDGEREYLRAEDWCDILQRMAAR